MRPKRQPGEPGRLRFKTEVARWAAVIKVNPKQVRLQHMTRRWASCSAGGRISFNDDLLAQPRRFRDYVIVHELLHLKVPNHGKLFKSLLKAYLPDGIGLAYEDGRL